MDPQFGGGISQTLPGKTCMIIISPYAKPLPDGSANPKNYPHWQQLLDLIPDVVLQVGKRGEPPLVDHCMWDLPLDGLRKLLQDCTTWISCDSMFQHLAWQTGKRGIVLWGQSDPLIFGHEENINLLKGREYLYHNQFLSWDLIPMRHDCWVEPQQVIDALAEFYG